MIKHVIGVLIIVALVGIVNFFIDEWVDFVKKLEKYWEDKNGE